MAKIVRRSWEIDRVLRAPADLVWALAADTNRWDRLVGFAESQWTNEIVNLNGVRESRRVGRVPMYWGKEARFAEVGWWVEGQSLHAERRFYDGHWSSCGYELSLSPATEPSATRVQMMCWIDFKADPSPPVEEHFAKKMPAIIARYLDLIEQTVAPHGHVPRPIDDSPCTFLRARLFERPLAPELAGPSTVANYEELAQVGSRLSQVLGNRVLADKLLRLVAERSDDELRNLRPYELASAWGLPERDVLRAFLIGTERGLFELKWNAICPVCRVSAVEFAKLHTTTPEVACSGCSGEFEVDLAANLEATFRVHSSIRPLDQRFYCQSGPWQQPHLMATVVVPLGETRTLRLDGPPSRLIFALHEPQVIIAPWRQGTSQLQLGTLLTVDWDGAAFQLHNHTPQSLEVLVERPTVGSVCRASDLLLMPEFLDRFSDDAPRAGGELSIGEATLLFADITGSTALYEELGDARAFALVQGYFRAIEHVAAQAGGALVKTMGDGVMVAFPSTQAGVRAALDALAPSATLDPRLRLKIGLHTGPCLIVGANGRIDFFGTTVNIAARLSGLAGGGELLVLQPMLERAGVQQILGDRGLAGRTFPTRLKGLRASFDCVALSPMA